MTLQEHANQVEGQVKEVLEQLAYGMIDLDTIHPDGNITSAFINYTEQDMFNAATILYHVCGNYAIKHGLLTRENTTEKTNRFREMLKDTFGLDTIEEAQKLIINSDYKRYGGRA